MAFKGLNYLSFGRIGELGTSLIDKVVSWGSGYDFSKAKKRLANLLEALGDNSTVEIFVKDLCVSVDLLVKNKGFFTGNRLYQWLQDRLAEKGFDKAVTFSNANTEKSLFIVALNMSKGHSEIFSATHTPHVAMVDAVRISMSIPFFFEPFTVNHKNHKEYVYTDGGVLDNYPINIFDDLTYQQHNLLFYTPFGTRQYNDETLGFRLVNSYQKKLYGHGTEESPSSKLILDDSFKSFLNYSSSLIYNIIEKQESDHMMSGDQARTIYIDYKNVSAVDFELSQDNKEALIEEGRDGVKNYVARLRNDNCYEFQSSRLWFYSSVLGRSALTAKFSTPFMAAFAGVLGIVAAKDERIPVRLMLGGAFAIGGAFFSFAGTTLAGIIPNIISHNLAHSRYSFFRQSVCDRAGNHEHSVKMNSENTACTNGVVASFLMLTLTNFIPHEGFKAAYVALLIFAFSEIAILPRTTSAQESFNVHRRMYTPRLSYQR